MHIYIYRYAASHLHHLPPTWAASPWPGQVSFATKPAGCETAKWLKDQVRRHPGCKGLVPLQQPTHDLPTAKKLQKNHKDGMMISNFLSRNLLVWFTLNVFKCHESTWIYHPFFHSWPMLAYINIELSFQIRPRLNRTPSHPGKVYPQNATADSPPQTHQRLPSWMDQLPSRKRVDALPGGNDCSHEKLHQNGRLFSQETSCLIGTW